MASTRPEASAPVLTKSRRVMEAVMSHLLGRAVDGGANTLVGAAATDVAAHGGIDVRVRRRRVLGEQGRGRHELARLAVPALRHVELEPGALERMASIGPQAFDRRHPLPRGC